MSNSDKIIIGEATTIVRSDNLKGDAGEIAFNSAAVIKIQRTEDSSAPNSSIYYSTDQNELCYKNETGQLFRINLTIIE